MARIRSVHPGLFTDEAFVGLSDAAQIFSIALWTEADDQGVFEWKPVQLRIRLRAGKDGAVEPLLAELEAANLIRRYETAGRQYGAVRNFRRFQKPKSPNAVHPVPSEFRKYLGLSEAISETPLAEPPPFPPKGEKSPQMEDGGGSREEGSSLRSSAAAASPRTRKDLDHIEAECRAAAGLENATGPAFLNLAPLIGLIDRGYGLDLITTVLRSQRGKTKPRSWAYFVPAIEEAAAANEAIKPAAAAETPAETWAKRRPFMARYQAIPDDWGQPRSWPADVQEWPEARQLIVNHANTTGEGWEPGMSQH